MMFLWDGLGATCSIILFCAMCIDYSGVPQGLCWNLYSLLFIWMISPNLIVTLILQMILLVLILVILMMWPLFHVHQNFPFQWLRDTCRQQAAKVQCWVYSPTIYTTRLAIRKPRALRPYRMKRNELTMEKGYYCGELEYLYLASWRTKYYRKFTKGHPSIKKWSRLPEAMSSSLN